MEQSVQTDRVAAYLDELRPHLDDLDPTERAEVLDELADALREVAAEHDEPLHDVVGPPADYVAAYRASAGLGQGRPQRPGSLQALATTVRAQRWWRHLRALAVLLQPAWWTLRGALLAGPLVFGLGVSFPPVTTLIAAALFIGGIAASLRVGAGHRHARGARLLVLAGNVTAVVIALSLVSMAASDQGDPEPESMGVPMLGQLVKPNGDPVTNIHPYTREGEPLTDVLLFDDAGRPLNVFAEDVNLSSFGIETEYERDADDQPITNLYPLQQSIIEQDPGEVPTRRPRTAPTIVLPPSVRPGTSTPPVSNDTAS